MNLDFSKWKKFKISDIFLKKQIKKIPMIPTEDGEINFISSCSTNNGVVKRINHQKKGTLIGEPCITISTNGNCFDCFFQNEPFYCSTDVEVIFNENINKFTGLFLCTILKLQQIKYSYGLKPKNNKVWDTIIKLPATNDGTVDWELIENYIKSLFEKEKELNELSNPFDKNKTTINIKEFENFKIDDFFDVSRGRRIVKGIDYSTNTTEKNIYPVITATTQNNGIDGYYDKWNCEGKVIICGGEATGMFSTFHDEKCWIMDRARILKPKHDFLNKYIAFYLITLFNANMIKFSYGLSANPDDIKKINIKLPVKNDGTVDWELIENYIKSLPYSKYL